MGTLRNPARFAKQAVKIVRKSDREPLRYVHLDECGDAVCTDSYRLLVAKGVWDGPSVNLPIDEVERLAKLSVKVESVEIGGDDGGIKYPNYKQLFEGFEANTVAYVSPKLVLPIVREHIRMKTKTIVLGVHGSEFTARGYAPAEPMYRLDKSCDGADVEIGFDPKYLRDALMMAPKLEIRITNGMKPAVFAHGDFELLLMPVRLDGAKPTAEKKERKHAPKDVDRDKVLRAIHHLAIDRAANDRDSKVEGGNASTDERNLVWALGKDGRLSFEESGNYVAWSLDGQFVCTIERRWAKRRVNLHYPELKPICHRANLLETETKEEHMEKLNLKGETVCITGTLGTMTRSEAFTKLKLVGGIPAERFTSKVTVFVIAGNAGKTKREKADAAIAKGQQLRIVSGTEFEAALAEAFNRPVAAPPKAETPKPEKPKAPEPPKVHVEKEGNVNKQIAELEAKLAEMAKALEAQRATTESWKAKAQEYYDAKPKAEQPEHKPEPKAGGLEVTEAITVEAMCALLTEFAKDKPGLRVEHANEKAPVWLCGDSRPWKQLIEDRGLRFGSSKKYGKGWYYGEREREALAKKLAS